MNIVARFLIIISLLFSFSQLLAQKFEGGFMGGLLGSQVAGDVSSGYNKLGFYGGISVCRQLTEKSGLQLELYFIQKGASENPSEENGNFQYLMRVNYIELPLLYRYIIGKQLVADAGVAYSYLTGTPYEEANYSTSVPDTPFNLGSVTFISGLEYRITPNLSAHFRTNNSITPIRPHASGAKRIFNRGQYSDILSLGLHYHFITF
jgi:hypothetical protein